MLNKIALQGKLFLCLSVYLLSACGGVPISNNEIARVLPTLNQIECPDMDGVYENSKDGLLGLFLIRLAFDFSREESSPSSEGNKSRRGKLNPRERILEIKRVNPYSLQITYYGDKTKKSFSTVMYIYKKAPPREVVTAGCYQNALIVRKIYALGGNDFVRITKHAMETQFRRLISGDLEVKVVENSWSHDRPMTTKTKTEIFKQYRETEK